MFTDIIQPGGDFIFPNELHVTWTIMIVLYPYITGLVAGAFIVSSLYHVFGQKSLQPISRFALVSSFIFLIFAPLPLLIHLGIPSRAFNIMITPNFSSAMAGFGYIYLAYLVLVFLEVWFITRKDLVQTSASSGGVKALFYRILAFGNLDMSDDIQESSRKIIKFLAAIGIPIACLLHGYVGFLFGSIKANPWWSTPLMFIIFLLSAIVSGVSVLIFLYFFISWLRRKSLDWACVQTMANLLWGFFIIDVVLELLEVLSISYQQMKDWQALSILLHDKLFVTHYVIQLGICSTIPFIFLGINAIFKPRRAVSGFLVFSSSILLLIQVLAMRWNVVIGGQLMSKSMRGYTSYIPGLFEKEGLLAAITIFTVPFILLWVIDKIVPLFKDEPHLQNVPQNQAQDH